MTDALNKINRQIQNNKVGGSGQNTGIRPTGPQSAGSPGGIGGIQGPSFQDVLGRMQQGQEVKFSKHASQRLQSRDINLSQEDMAKIDGALKKAEAKGIKDALILMQDKVFIANVKSRTIITASTETDLKDNVFTQIDGAVII